MLVIGSGFAGLRAALDAARRLDELAEPAGTVDVTVLSDKPFRDIRVRNYETDLSACRIPLADVLDPAGLAHVTAAVTGIDPGARALTTASGASYRYDRVVLAPGSRAARPGIPVLREFGFDVDTYDGAVALRAICERWSGTPTRAAGRHGGRRPDRHRGGLRAAEQPRWAVRPASGHPAGGPRRARRDWLGHGRFGAAGDSAGVVGQRHRDPGWG